MKPACIPNHYQDDCKDCAKPMIQQSPTGPLTKCDGKIFLCQFATGATTYPACNRFNITNYACSHGGGSCQGNRIKKERYIY